MTTLNLEVTYANRADDGYSSDPGGYWSNTVSAHFTGYYSSNGKTYYSYSRFTGVSGLSGATIDSAYYKIYRWSDSYQTNVLTKVYAEDAEAPSAPTSNSDHLGRTRTTAGVDWDGTLASGLNTSPDVKSVIQELADGYDPSAILILHDDDGSSDINLFHSVAADYGTGWGAKLDITYTAGGGPSGPAAGSLALMGVGR